MPTYKAVLIKKKLTAPILPMQIQRMTIEYVAKDLHEAEFKVMVWCKYTYHDMEVNSVHQIDNNAIE